MLMFFCFPITEPWHSTTHFRQDEAGQNHSAANRKATKSFMMTKSASGCAATPTTMTVRPACG